jgi:hypothetical protein
MDLLVTKVSEVKWAGKELRERMDPTALLALMDLQVHKVYQDHLD